MFVEKDKYKSDLFLPIFSALSGRRTKKETGHRRKTITNIHNHQLMAEYE